MEAYQVLENSFGEWANEKHMVVCSSGTAALHLALEALQLPLGSYVIVPEFTMVACARAVSLAGLVPIFVDCNRDDLCINTKTISDYLVYLKSVGELHKVKAIMPVHVYGRRCAMEEITSIAHEYHLFVVEDLAEAHGLGKHEMSDAGSWSFYRNKIIAGEEGGAVAFRSSRTAELARSLRTLGFTSEHNYKHIPRGHNYRLSNIHASQIIHSMSQYADNLIERRRLEGCYEALCPAEYKMPYRAAPWVYDLRIPSLNPATQDHIIKELNGAGIAARHAFQPMSWQDEYMSNPRYDRMPANAARASIEIVYLPLTPGKVNEEMITKSFSIVSELCGNLVGNITSVSPVYSAT